MNTNNRFYKLQDFSLVRLFQTVFLFVAGFLFVAALNEYKGDSYIYVIFTVMSNALLYFGFRKNAIFFDTFIGLFFWLGFWLKLTIRVAFMDGGFHEAVGNFNGSGVEFDRALLVSSCGFLGLLAASLIRERFLFIYADKGNDAGHEGLFEFYKAHRKAVLIGFMVLFSAVAVTNILARGAASSIVTTRKPSIDACNAQIGSISVIQTVAPKPRSDCAHPLPTSP